MNSLYEGCKYPYLPLYFPLKRPFKKDRNPLKKPQKSPVVVRKPERKKQEPPDHKKVAISKDLSERLIKTVLPTCKRCCGSAVQYFGATLLISLTFFLRMGNP